MNLDRVIAVRNTRTIFRDGNRCIKLFNRSVSKSEVLREALNLARVEEAGIHTPRISKVSAAEDRWAIVYEYIRGESLEHLMEKEPENRKGYLEWFADIHLSLRQYACPGLTRLHDQLKEQIQKAGLSEEAGTALCRHLAAMPEGDSVCHGDFEPSNIIISENGIPYIIDWDNVTTGPFAADAAWTYLRFLLQDDEEGAKGYLEHFCQKGGMDEKEILAWLPIMAAARSAVSSKDRREKLLEFGKCLERGEIG